MYSLPEKLHINLFKSVCFRCRVYDCTNLECLHIKILSSHCFDQEGRGGSQADLQSEEQSGERSPRKQQGREVEHCGAPDHLYYKGGMPSAKTSLIEAHPRYFLEPFGWSSRIMSSSVDVAWGASPKD